LVPRGGAWVKFRSRGSWSWGRWRRVVGDVGVWERGEKTTRILEERAARG
jgi:hypothetical protein